VRVGRGRRAAVAAAEDSGIKIDSVASTLTTLSARDMIEALIGGERDPAVLADLARGVMRKKIPALTMACAGRFSAQHALMCTLYLEQNRCAPRGVTGSGGGARPLSPALSQQRREAEGSLVAETRLGVGAALTRPGQASTVRWSGFGERDWKVDARNQCLKPCRCSTGSNLTDVGRDAAHAAPGGGDSEAGLSMLVGRPR